MPLKIPSGLNADDTTYAASGLWADCNNVRFDRGQPQTVGGWESLTTELLVGVCRGVFPWSDNAGALNIAFGTHRSLEVWFGGELATITPAFAMPAATLGSNPLAVSDGSATVVVTQPGHGLASGDQVALAGAVSVGGVTPNGGPFSVTKIDGDRYSFAFMSSATSTTSGGGAAVVATPLAPLEPGAVDGTGGAGFGTGAYSAGGYSEPSTSDFYPRTWSLAAWGQQLLASPRGGTIFAWANDPTVRAAPLLNAPARCSHMVVAPQDMVFALGCNEEVSNRFNPLCIRHSSVRKNTEWATGSATTAREYILPGGGRIVAGRVIGSYLMVWTSHGLFLGSYVGSLQQVWRFDRVADKCGLIGPNAAVVVGQEAYWLGVDGQFYRYVLGGGVQPITCPIRDDLFNNLTPSQADKIVASSISRFSEVRWDYPDARDGTENSRYVVYSLAGQGWARGRQARTAFVDAGPTPDPIGVAPEGQAYWHERGQSADGAPLTWSLETTDLYFSEEKSSLLLGIWPDLKRQVGPVNLTVLSRQKPQGSDAISGPFAMATGDDKLDLRCSGRFFRLRFSGGSFPAFVRFGQIAAEIAGTGKR